MLDRRIVTFIVRADALANALLAALVGVAIGPLADALALDRWLLGVVAAVLLGNGLLLWRAAWRGYPDRGRLRLLGAGDIVFTLAVLAYAVLAPAAVASWARWALAALGVGVGLVGAVKLLAASRADDTATYATSRAA